MKVYVLVRETNGYDGSWGASSTFHNSCELKGVYKTLDRCRKAAEKIAVANGAYEYDDYDKTAKFEWDDEKLRYTAQSKHNGIDLCGTKFCDYTETCYVIYEEKVI